MKEMTFEEMEKIEGGKNPLYQWCVLGWMLVGMSLGGFIGGAIGIYFGQNGGCI